jgi:hydrogenase nickel incorporation protein HypA/HybF
MHEVMVALSVFEAISAEANKQNARPVSAKISCGVLNAISPDALCFAFEAISKDTVCQGVRLNIEQKPIQARCRKCDATFSFDLHSPTCPKCKGDDFELMPDAPIMLDEIEFEG